MTIVYGIAHFEVFLADLIKLLYQYFPKALSSKDKVINYDMVLQYDSLQDLMNQLIETETNSFSFKSITQRVSFMEKNSDLNLNLIKKREFETIGIVLK